MSEYEGVFEDPRDDTRYSTPVPELDDHRHQSVSVQRPERSRRGTVDTLYGTTARGTVAADLGQSNEGNLRVDARDLEEVVADGESENHSPAYDRSRRPTVASVEARDLSPP